MYFFNNGSLPINVRSIDVWQMQSANLVTVWSICLINLLKSGKHSTARSTFFATNETTNFPSDVVSATNVQETNFASMKLSLSHSWTVTTISTLTPNVGMLLCIQIHIWQ
jgi:hypothetical protein